MKHRNDTVQDFQEASKAHEFYRLFLLRYKRLKELQGKENLSYCEFTSTNRQNVWNIGEYSGSDPKTATEWRDTLNHGVVCKKMFTPKPLSQNNKLDLSLLYKGHIVNYNITKTKLNSYNGSIEEVAYVTLTCELYDGLGIFLADFQVNCNITRNSDFTCLLTNLNVTITDKEYIDLDCLLGKKVECQLVEKNNFISIAYMYEIL